MDCCGRECKLGWGWDESTNRLIPVEGNPSDFKTNDKNEWMYDCYLSSSDIQPFVSFLVL